MNSKGNECFSQGEQLLLALYGDTIDPGLFFSMNDSFALISLLTGLVPVGPVCTCWLGVCSLTGEISDINRLVSRGTRLVALTLFAS